MSSRIARTRSRGCRWGAWLQVVVKERDNACAGVGRGFRLVAHANQRSHDQADDGEAPGQRCLAPTSAAQDSERARVLVEERVPRLSILFDVAGDAIRVEY